jgi:hypothetical protein
MERARCRDCQQLVDVEHGRYVKHGECAGWFARVDDQAGWEQKLESRFTDPRPDCPHPGRWHSDDADSTEWEVTELVAAFVKALRPDVVVETGSAWGQTAFAIGEALHVGGRLYTLEPNPERVAATKKRCVTMPWVKVIETTSLEWAPKLFEGEPVIGFAWLDSLHHLRVPEFRRFYPHMAPGAFVGFHDTGPHQGTLREEILQLEAEGFLLPVFLPTPRGCCFAEVIR